MRLLRLLVASVVSLCCILMVISLFIPSQIRISRAVDIHAPRQKVFDAVNDLREWDQWNQFTAHTLLGSRVFSNPSAGYGALMKTDLLSILIVESTPDSIRTNWDQAGAKRFDSDFYLVAPKNGYTTLLWFFDLKLRWYPWEKFTSLVLDKQLGPVMEESLADLKHLAENNP